MSQETPANPRRWHYAVIGVIVVFFILVAAAWFSLSVVADLPVTSDKPYPYTVTYHVSVPDGKELTIGGVPFLAVSAGDEAIVKSGETRERIKVNETRTIAERRAKVTTLGIPVIDTNYRMNVTFSGTRGEFDVFDISLQTSSQVPSFLLDRTVPAGMAARPA